MQRAGGGGGRGARSGDGREGKQNAGSGGEGLSRRGRGGDGEQGRHERLVLVIWSDVGVNVGGRLMTAFQPVVLFVDALRQGRVRANGVAAQRRRLGLVAHLQRAASRGVTDGGVLSYIFCENQHSTRLALTSEVLQGRRAGAMALGKHKLAILISVPVSQIYIACNMRCKPGSITTRSAMASLSRQPESLLRRCSLENNAAAPHGNLLPDYAPIKRRPLALCERPRDRRDC